MALPIDAHADRIVRHVDEHRVTVIHGETGCGKSSRVPLLLLAARPEARMFVSQPRRIAAIGVADRIASERGESVGEVVGYAIRGEARACERTALMFNTTGVALRRLQEDGLAGVATDCRMDFAIEADGDASIVNLAMSYEPASPLALLAAPVLVVDNWLALNVLLPNAFSGKPIIRQRDVPGLVFFALLSTWHFGVGPAIREAVLAARGG